MTTQELVWITGGSGTGYFYGSLIEPVVPEGGWPEGYPDMAKGPYREIVRLEDGKSYLVSEIEEIGN